MKQGKPCKHIKWPGRPVSLWFRTISWRWSFVLYYGIRCQTIRLVDIIPFLKPWMVLNAFYRGVIYDKIKVARSYYDGWQYISSSISRLFKIIWKNRYIRASLVIKTKYSTHTIRNNGLVMRKGLDYFPASFFTPINYSTNSRKSRS